MQDKILAERELILKKIEVLESIKEYLFDILHLNEIQPSTYMKVSAAIDTLVYELQNKYQYGFDNVVNLSSTEIIVSFDDLYDIQTTAKPRQDGEDIKVNKLTNILVTLFKQFLELIMKRPQKEFLEEDIDKLLAAFEKADKYIASEQ